MNRLPVNDADFLPRAEAAWLEGIASSLPDPAVAIEIGTGKGNSTTAMAYGLALHRGWHIYTVDVGDCVEGRARIKDAGIPDERVTFYQMPSVNVAAQCEVMADLVFVDGAHTFEGVRADILAFGPLVKIGGIMAFDDYCLVHLGVMQAVEQLAVQHQWRLFGQVGRLIAYERILW